MQKTPRFVSRKEVCEALGISRQRLHVLIGEGRIEETPMGIDVDKALVEYKGTIDPARRAAYEEAQQSAATEPLGSEPSKAKAKVTIVDEDTGERVDFAAARTRKELENAKRARLEYQIKAGNYIARDEVMAKEFAIGRKLRDRILGWPARVANLVPPEAMYSLAEECDALVRELQDDVASIAAETNSG